MLSYDIPKLFKVEHWQQIVIKMHKHYLKYHDTIHILSLTHHISKYDLMHVVSHHPILIEYHFKGKSQDIVPMHSQYQVLHGKNEQA